MIDVSPREFLKVITHDRIDDVWAIFVPDLEQAKGPSGRHFWFGQRFTAYEAAGLPQGQNSFYALGLLRPPVDSETDRRVLDRWMAGTLCLLDDVVEKSVDPATIRAELGDPTFIVQTSAGSQQWGYVLQKPVTDLLQMSRLQKAFTLRYYPSGKDPGAERPIQPVRIPFGVNNKKTRLDAAGKGFDVHLAEWQPTLRHDVLDIMTALEEHWGAACTAVTSVTAQGLQSGVYTAAELDGYYKTDPVFRAFKEANMVEEGRVNNGYIGVTCPWDAQHTVRDDSAGYNPRERNFKCFHSHPEGTPADLDAWFHANLFDLTGKQHTYKGLRHKLVADQFAMHPLPDDETEPQHVPGTGLKTLEPLATLALSVMAARKSICSHLARGEVTYRIGMPAVGKSALALAYALAIATERPDLVGEKTLKRTGAIIILSNEDTRVQYAKRMRGWLDKHKLGQADLVHPIYTPNVNGVYVVTSDDNEVVSLHPDMAWLSDEIRRLRAEGIDVAMALVDTQAACFHKVEENSNGAMGQAMSLLAQWAEANNAALEIIHHIPKPKGFENAGDEMDLMSARGASAAGASVRNAVGMRPLAKAINAELPPGERGRWIKELGVKSNHGPKMDAKYWFREIEPVWADTGDVDEEGNMIGEPEGQPVYVYSATGPKPAFDATDTNAILAAVTAIDDAAPLDRKVKAGANGNGSLCAADAVKAALGRSLDDARDAIKAAHEHGYIEHAAVRNEQTRRDVKVWALTETGRAFLVECREKALTTTEET